MAQRPPTLPKAPSASPAMTTAPSWPIPLTGAAGCFRFGETPLSSIRPPRRARSRNGTVSLRYWAIVSDGEHDKCHVRVVQHERAADEFVPLHWLADQSDNRPDT